MTTKRSRPADWPQIASSLAYDDAGQAIDWLCRAFGFQVRLRVDGEGGTVVHSELEHGEGLIMVGSGKRPDQEYRKSPRALGGANTQSIMVYVADVEAHCQKARAEGAKIVTEPKTSDYGEGYWVDRGYEAIDPEGHHWWFIERLRDNPKK